MISILNIFKVLKINGFVNYLLLNKYVNIFQYEMKDLKFYLLKDKVKRECFEILSFKDKLKMNM